MLRCWFSSLLCDCTRLCPLTQSCCFGTRHCGGHLIVRTCQDCIWSASKRLPCAKSTCPCNFPVSIHTTNPSISLVDAVKLLSLVLCLATTCLVQVLDALNPGLCSVRDCVSVVCCFRALEQVLEGRGTWSCVPESSLFTLMFRFHRTHVSVGAQVRECRKNIPESLRKRHAMEAGTHATGVSESVDVFSHLFFVSH